MNTFHPKPAQILKIQLNFSQYECLQLVSIENLMKALIKLCSLGMILFFHKVATSHPIFVPNRILTPKPQSL